MRLSAPECGTYEIAAYGTAREFAQVLGELEHAELLEQTLGRRKETDEELTTLTREINPPAPSTNVGAEEKKAASVMTSETKRPAAH